MLGTRGALSGDERMLEEVSGCGPALRDLHKAAGEEIQQLWGHLVESKEREKEDKIISVPVTVVY